MAGAGGFERPDDALADVVGLDPQRSQAFLRETHGAQYTRGEVRDPSGNDEAGVL